MHVQKSLKFVIICELVISQVEDECGKIPTVIVQNKIDLIERGQVDP